MPPDPVLVSDRKGDSKCVGRVSVYGGPVSDVAAADCLLEPRAASSPSGRPLVIRCLWNDSFMGRKDEGAGDLVEDGIPTDYSQLAVSETGLDWGDVSQIREKLKLTPTERLQSVQDFMNAVLRIRAQNVR